MPNSCFGCCSIRHGVSCIYIFNIFWITLVIMNDFIYRLSNYFQPHEHTSFENTTSQTLIPDLYPDEDILLNFNSTDKDLYQSKQIRLDLSEMFMDCVFIIKLGWSVMEFYLNISLKESTYSVSPEKIYAWLVIYYFNLVSGTIHQLYVIFYQLFDDELLDYSLGFIEIIILVVEIYIVQSYYKQQKLAAVNDFVQLKWKYLPNSKMQSHQNKSEVVIISENPLDQTQDQSNYIPIFVKELRKANS
uniref:Transmembrane protein n=1 Tax=Schizaphis graminum TaxID=13262 RepID=A0A2S2P1X7_SCHGA